MSGPRGAARSTLGHPRVHLRSTASTNDHARGLALRGAPHGTLVTAAEQSAGRGRQGRSWSAPPGSSLLMSIVLRWPVSERYPAILPLLAAVAVCDVAGADARIKWPNDIVVPREPTPGERAGRKLARPEPVHRELVRREPPTHAKLAGILVEGRPQQGWAVLGIGVNVAVRVEDLPAALRETAATLGRERTEIEPFLDALLTAFERRSGQPPAEVLDAWRDRDVLCGHEVAWSQGHKRAYGRAAGIDDGGRLLVDLTDGSRTALAAGEVHLGRP